MAESSVAGIFKILIKIPIVIVISYLIINVYAFSLSYFRILGASYSLQQIVMENNYLPEREANSFEKYLQSLETGFLTNITAVVYTDTDISDASGYTGRNTDGRILDATSFGVVVGNNSRQQYGDTAYVGIVSNFSALWPFRYDQLIEEGGVQGYSDATGIHNTRFRDEEDLRNNRLHTTAKIDIIHPVIGLQYYSDLE